jgi:hypothetical protein
LSVAVPSQGKKGKGKGHPRTGHKGPEEELMYNYSSFNRGAIWWCVVNGTPRPRERPATHCIGGWVGPMAGLNGCGKSRPYRDSIPGPSIPYPVAIPTKLSRPVTRQNKNGVSGKVFTSLAFISCPKKHG